MPAQATTAVPRSEAGVDFALALAQRPFASSAHLRLHVRTGVEVGGSPVRFAVLVPKRIVRSAVLRNAVKRRLREAFRAQAPGLTALELLIRLKGFDLKVPKSVALRAVFDEAKRLLEGLHRAAPCGVRPVERSP